jgi:hypothetical protein
MKRNVAYLVMVTFGGHTKIDIPNQFVQYAKKYERLK